MRALHWIQFLLVGCAASTAEPDGSCDDCASGGMAGDSQMESGGSPSASSGGEPSASGGSAAAPSGGRETGGASQHSGGSVAAGGSGGEASGGVRSDGGSGGSQSGGSGGAAGSGGEQSSGGSAEAGGASTGGSAASGGASPEMCLDAPCDTPGSRDYFCGGDPQEPQCTKCSPGWCNCSQGPEFESGEAGQADVSGGACETKVTEFAHPSTDCFSVCTFCVTSEEATAACKE